MKIEREIIKEIIRENVKTRKDLEKAKRKIMAFFKKFPPSNINLLKFYHEMTKNQKEKIFKESGRKFTPQKDSQIRKILATRPVRSLSGIVNVSVLTKPYPCPGKCIYCPQEKESPKSYLKSEPAVMRAIMNKYNPGKQVETRIKSLLITGHPVDKIEMRIIGGTWSYYPKKYQNWFIKECFRACNQNQSQKSKTKSQKLQFKNKSL